MNNILNKLKDFYINYENIFLVAFGEAVDQYSKICNCINPYYSERVKLMMKEVPEIFDFNKIQGLYNKLSGISEHFNINATGIPFPIDMSDVIDKYSLDFRPPVLRLFNVNIMDKLAVENFSSKELTGIVRARLSECDIDKLKYYFILKRITEGEEINELDKNFFIINSSQNKFTDIRIDSFIKYVIGIYCWDIEKSGNSIKKGYELYQDYQKRCNKCGDSKCFKEMNYNRKFTIPNESQSEYFYCKNIETCKRFVRESYKLVSSCIRDCNLYNSNHNSKSYHPKEKRLIFQRKKLSFFSGEQ